MTFLPGEMSTTDSARPRTFVTPNSFSFQMISHIYHKGEREVYFQWAMSNSRMESFFSKSFLLYIRNSNVFIYFLAAENMIWRRTTHRQVSWLFPSVGNKIGNRRLCWTSNQADKANRGRSLPWELWSRSGEPLSEL